MSNSAAQLFIQALVLGFSLSIYSFSGDMSMLVHYYYGDLSNSLTSLNYICSQIILISFMMRSLNFSLMQMYCPLDYFRKIVQLHIFVSFCTFLLLSSMTINLGSWQPE
jgi:hypothetical protein